MDTKTIKWVRSLGACPDAVKWLVQQQNRAQAWRCCERAEWMLWLLAKTIEPGSPRHKRLVLVTCRIAHDRLRFVPAQKKQTLREALCVARRWAKGLATLEEVQDAGNAALDIYVALIESASSRAAYAIAIACATRTPIRRSLAWTVAHIASIAANSDRTRLLRQYARWVRQAFPSPPRQNATHSVEK